MSGTSTAERRPPSTARGSISRRSSVASRRRSAPRGPTPWRPTWSPRRPAARVSTATPEELPRHPGLRPDVEDRPPRSPTSPSRRASLPGDSPQWSPDGRDALCPRPARAVSRRPTPRARRRSGSTRSGSERTRLRDLEPGGTNDLLRSESVADLVAIQVETGQVRTVLPASSQAEPAMLRLSPRDAGSRPCRCRAASSPEVFEYVFDLVLVATSGGEPSWIARGLPIPDNPFVGSYQWHPTRDLLVYSQGGKLWVIEPEGVPRRDRNGVRTRLHVAPGLRAGRGIDRRSGPERTEPSGDAFALVVRSTAPLPHSRPRGRRAHRGHHGRSPGPLATDPRCPLRDALPAGGGGPSGGPVRPPERSNPDHLNRSVGGLSRIAGNRDQTSWSASISGSTLRPTSAFSTRT